MLKKVIPIVISLCLILGVSVMAENEIPRNEENIPEVSKQIPQDTEERLNEGRGGMPPWGEKPSGDFVPPEGMGGFRGNMQNNSERTTEAEPLTFWGFVKTYSTPITSVILLALAFIFVIFYRRKNY